MADKSPVHDAIYLDTSARVDRFLQEIADAREIALDTEGASYHRFVDRIYLLQLSTRDRSAILDPLPIGTPVVLSFTLPGAAAPLTVRGKVRWVRGPEAVPHDDTGGRGLSAVKAGIGVQFQDIDYASAAAIRNFTRWRSPELFD